MTCASTNTIAALLAGAADPDAAAQLEVHLDQCPACRRLVAELGRGLSMVARAAPSESLPRIGEAIGRYAIASVVGVGGMGVVYRAHDATLDREVAIKLLRPDLGDGPSLLAEAQAMARLQHPNIVSVHDAGIANGRLFVCMEYVHGSTLRARVAMHPRDWRAIARLYRAAGEGLAYVHRAKLVHLDFKPDNVLVDRDGRVRVTDFGLARMIGTREARIAGTPAYMAPEQRRGGTVDARADQYAFCASLREALLCASPPARLRRAIERGLATRPDDRFATLEALLAEIDAAIAPRRRPLAGIAVIAAAATVAFAVTSPQTPRVVTRTIDRAQPAWRDRIVERAVPAADAPASFSHGAPAATAPRHGVRAHAARAGFQPRRTVPVLHVAPVLFTTAANDAANDVDDADRLDGDPSSTAWPPTCNDGTALRCADEPPFCPGREVAAIRNGCWSCEDPLTCWSYTLQPIAPAPRPPRAPTPASGSNSGSNSGSGGGSGTGSGSNVEPVCGNGLCEAGETHATCESDCCETDAAGACLATCGNGFCENGEDHASCADDCCETTTSGACVPVCGNGFCEVDESCAADCG